MRIALYHNAPSGGAKRAIYEWAWRLTENHELDVYTLNTADHEFCDIRPFVDRHQVADFVPNKIFRSPFGRLNQFQRQRDLEKLTKINKEQAKQIDSRLYDVVFAHTCQFTFIPPILLFLKTPAVFYLHEPFGRGFHRQITRPYLEQNRIRARLDHYDPLISMYREKLFSLQDQGVKSTSLLLANSKFTQQQMKDTHGIDAPVNHCGVDLDGFRPQPETKKESFVLSVGEMSPRKGFEFVVESLGRIPGNIRPQLKLACNRIEMPEFLFIDELAERNKVKLEVCSDLDTKEMATLYNRASLCVYAPVLEPFGLVPLEAMACGTPVVGVNEGGMKESIIHEYTGLLVERDSQKFASAIQYLLANPSLAAEYGDNSRKYVEGNWTWDQSTSDLEGHLCNTAQGRLLAR